METEYKISFAEFLKNKQGSVRQRYCEIDGFIFGHGMQVRHFSIVHNGEVIAYVNGSTEGKILFSRMLGKFLDCVSSEPQVMNNILSYSLKDGARRFTVFTYEQYMEALQFEQERGKGDSFKNKTRPKKFVSGGKTFFLSADVNICEQMEFCCEIIPIEEQDSWYFYAIPSYEPAYSKDFIDECEKLDKKVKKDRIKGICELNNAYKGNKNKEKNKRETKIDGRSNRKGSIPRNPIIVSMAKVIADGICELCDSDGLFHNAPYFEGYGPYVEIHHIKWLAAGGTDTLDNVAALCPVCHRKMHIINDKEDVKRLKIVAKQHEKKWEEIVEQSERVSNGGES